MKNICSNTANSLVNVFSFEIQSEYWNNSDENFNQLRREYFASAEL